MDAASDQNNHQFAYLKTLNLKLGKPVKLAAIN